MGISAGTKLPPPSFLTDVTEWQRKAATWMQQANQGHIDNSGTVSLLTGVASTVLTDSRIGQFSFIGFMPTTLGAATELGSGTLYVGSQSKGAATITHSISVLADRTYRFCILG